MATADLATDVINNLECSVCLEEVKDHRCLDCGHIYCRECLEKLVKDKEIKCPDCRFVQKKNCRDANQVKQMTKIVTINRIQESLIHHQAVNAGKIICAVCREIPEFCGVYCEVCHQMCKWCFAMHQLQQSFNGHRVRLMRKQTICKNHAGKIVDNVCRQCDEFVCILCAIQYHTDHVLVGLWDTLEDTLNRLPSLTIDTWYYRKNVVRDFREKIHKEYLTFCKMWSNIQEKESVPEAAVTARNGLTECLMNLICQLLRTEKAIDAQTSHADKGKDIDPFKHEMEIERELESSFHEPQAEIAETDCAKLLIAEQFIKRLEELSVPKQLEITKPVFPENSALETKCQRESFINDLINWKTEPETLKIYLPISRHENKEKVVPHKNPDFALSLASVVTSYDTSSITLSMDKQRRKFTVYTNSTDDDPFIVYDYFGVRLESFGESVSLEQIKPYICSDTTRDMIVIPICNGPKGIVNKLLRINKETNNVLPLKCGKEFKSKIQGISYCPSKDSYFLYDDGSEAIYEVNAEKGTKTQSFKFKRAMMFMAVNLSFGVFGKDNKPVFIAHESALDGEECDFRISVFDLKGQRIWSRKPKHPQVHDAIFGPDGYIFQMHASELLISTLKYEETDANNNDEDDQQIHEFPKLAKYCKGKSFRWQVRDIMYDQEARILLVTISDVTRSEGLSKLAGFTHVFIYHVTRSK